MKNNIYYQRIFEFITNNGKIKSGYELQEKYKDSNGKPYNDALKELCDEGSLKYEGGYYVLDKEDECTKIAASLLYGDKGKYIYLLMSKKKYTFWEWTKELSKISNELKPEDKLKFMKFIRETIFSK